MNTDDFRPAQAAEDEDMPTSPVSGEELLRELSHRQYIVADSPLFAAAAQEDVCIRPLPGYVGSVADSSADMYRAPGAAKSVHSGHREKLRKRFVQDGLSSFHKHEALELLLHYAIPRKDTNELAHRLLNAFGGRISDVFNADVNALKKVEGVGEQAAVFLTMIPQFLQIYRTEMLERAGVSGRYRVEQYIANRFTGERVEKVLVACLDNKYNLLGAEFTDVGSVNIAAVNQRKVIEVCLRYDATAAIIAHNHPRGTALPSRDDLTTTVETKKTMEMVGVRLVDHLIIAGEDYISLACSRLYADMFE